MDFDFKDILGSSSKTTKIIVLVALSIFGTMETIFYIQAGWRWWKRKYPDAESGTEIENGGAGG